MSAGRAWLVAAGLWAAAAGGAAELERAASSALQCLQGADSRLVYPPDMLERKDGGTISVELSFTRRDRGPAIKLLEDGIVLHGLEEAVRKHVAQFRVPCLAEGDPPVVLRQEYVFIPNDGRKVVSTAPRDVADEERTRKLACMRHVDGDQRPEYPMQDRSAGTQGNVLLRLRFDKPDAPPAATTLAAPKSRTLRNAVTGFVNGLRLPCLGDAPIDGQLLFTFVLQDDSRLLLKDLTLPRLLAAAQDLPFGAYFDLNTMGCPFDLRWTYFRPYAPNTVGELESSVPARRAFLDWLSLITLKLPETSRNTLIGQTIGVSVPCTIIDL